MDPSILAGGSGLSAVTGHSHISGGECVILEKQSKPGRSKRLSSDGRTTPISTTVKVEDGRRNLHSDYTSKQYGKGWKRYYLIINNE